MASADSYRNTAAELLAEAMKTADPAAATRLTALAECYLRLAEQADQNQFTDVWAEFGPKSRLEGEGM